MTELTNETPIIDLTVGELRALLQHTLAAVELPIHVGPTSAPPAPAKKCKRRRKPEPATGQQWVGERGSAKGRVLEVIDVSKDGAEVRVRVLINNEKKQARRVGSCYWMRRVSLRNDYRPLED